MNIIHQGGTEISHINIIAFPWIGYCFHPKSLNLQSMCCFDVTHRPYIINPAGQFLRYVAQPAQVSFAKVPVHLPVFTELQVHWLLTWQLGGTTVMEKASSPMARN